jgi:hypothetical protein
MTLDAIIPASEKELPASAGRAVDAFVDLLVKQPLAGALEGHAERKKEEIVRKLLKLELTKELREKLLPRFAASGFQLVNERRAQHPYGTPDHMYTMLQSNSREVALVQLPPGVFDANENGYELYVSDFAHMLKAFRGRTTRLFSEGLQGVPYAFGEALDDEKRDANWLFIQWSNVVALTKGKLAVWQAFKLPNPNSVPGHATPLLKVIGEAQLGCIVDVLTRFAINDKAGVDAAFKTLVSQSGWPNEWKNERLTGWKGVAPSDARDFVDYMMWKGTFPAGHELAGRSVLGEFLRNFLASGGLGGNDADSLGRIVVECALVPDADTFKKYYLP